MTANFTFLILCVAMLFFMYGDARSFKQRRLLIEDPNADWENWDRQYNLLSTGFMALMGAWCFFCFTLTQDLFIHLLCVATAMGNILSLICRNFADDRTLTLQLCAVAIPLIAGVLTYGDLRAMILCGFFMPLFSSMKDISNRLRILFSGMEEHSREKEEFGVQLNEALESMSHGLIMFDDEMKLKIINKTARRILKLDAGMNCYSKRLTEIARFVDMRRMGVNRVRILEDALLKRLKHRTADKVFEIDDREYVELSIMLRDNGGCVLVIEDVTQRINYQTRINELAKFDELTGLLNRSYFLQQAKSTLEAIPQGSNGALIFFDLDDFKRINDTLGHDAGDYILANVAQRLRKLLPHDALIARYGGDEYVLFLDVDLPQEDLEALCQKILDTITEKLTYQNQVLRYGASLGVAQYPADGRTIDRLLKLADLALYDAKNNGKNAFRFFTADLEDGLQQRLVMEDELTKAVRNGDLALHFQPIVDINTGKPKVFEALT
ncbi:MAG: diguanylate cyclase, partial [Pseudomonadota bacterium]